MGPTLSIIYALLMIAGYGSQVHEIYSKKSTKNLRLSFFAFLWVAVTLRMAASGILARETDSLTAIWQTIGDFAVFGGLFTIMCQIIWYRFVKKA